MGFLFFYQEIEGADRRFYVKGTTRRSNGYSFHDHREARFGKVLTVHKLWTLIRAHMVQLGGSLDRREVYMSQRCVGSEFHIL